MRAEDVVRMMDAIDSGASFTFPLGNGIDIMFSNTTVAIVDADSQTLVRSSNTRQMQELAAALTTWTHRRTRIVQAEQGLKH